MKIPAAVAVVIGCSISLDSIGADDTCVEDGGQAICVAPKTSEFVYGMPGISAAGQTSASGAGTTEAGVVADFSAKVVAKFNTCTFSITDRSPPWQPPQPGAGNAQGGTHGIAPYYSISWTLGAERNQLKYDYLVTGTWPQPQCNRDFSTGGATSINRSRAVLCPQGFSPNLQTPPANNYCYRLPAARDNAKNLGESCSGSGKSVSPAFGNPVSAATGNKLQEETDYVGTGAFPLRLARFYNSRLLSPSGSGETFASRFGHSWRSTYDRYIRFTDSATLPTAFVYRHDGKTLYFKLSGGQFVGDADIADRLVRLVDGSGNPVGWRYTSAKDEIEIYDNTGLLTSITDRGGQVQTLTYDSSGRLSTVTDSFGHVLAFTYDPNGRLATMTNPAGDVYTYTYNSVGNVTSVTYPDTRVRTYVYNEPANTSNANRPYALTGIVDEATTRFATFKYDTADRSISTEHAGVTGKYTFSYAANSTTVTDPLGTARTYGFANIWGVARNTSLNQPCTAGCGGGAAAATSYDVNGNPSSRTDFNGRVTNYSYDLTSNLETSRTEAFGTPRARTTSTQWDSTFRLPTLITETGKTTAFTYDVNGNVLTKTETATVTSAARTWTYTYDGYGRVLTADGPRTDVSDVTTYTYYTCTTGYHCGQVATITNAAGHVTTYDTYNAHGQPLTITDPNGLVTTLTYDLRQRLTSRTAGGEQTTFEYWPTGLLKKTTLPDGTFLSYTYDAAHRLTGVTDSEGNYVTYTLDNMGNRTAEQVFDPSSALTRTRTRVFNNLNRLWKELGAAGTANVTTTFAYDNNGNRTSISAPLSRNTAQTYDELNRLTQVTDPLSGVTQYGYNALDQLISVTDPRSKVTSYTYNALGDLTQQVSPDTGAMTNTYDSGGNVQTSTDARSKTGTYTYDALNRVTSLTYPDQTITYTYDSGTDQKGRLTQVTDNSGSTSWTYDAHGRVLSRQQTMGSISKSVGYSYDSYGRLHTLTLPSGNAVTYGYSDGKITSLTLNGSTTILSNALYQPFGPTRGWTWGNSTLAVREYDTDGKVTDIDSAGLETYGYDDAFRITSITDASDPNLSQSYGYDLLDRLTSATGTSLNQGWTYDANGNRLTQTGSQPSTYTVSSTSNRLSSVSGSLTRTYGYDASGNTTSDGAATFTYNDAGRMISATKASVTTSYALNALGQRVHKTTSSTSTYFTYDEAGHLIGEYDNAGNLTQETLWLGDTPVATLRPNGGGGVNVFYVHSDQLNTPRRVSRPSDDVVVWRWDSQPFGQSAANEDPDGDSNQFGYGLRFPGQFLDAETGLHYNYFRDYDSVIGRYVESDPIGLQGGLNTYAYARSNPLMYVDPNGLDAAAPAIPRPAPVPGVRGIPGWVRPPNPWLFLFYPSPLGDSDLGIAMPWTKDWEGDNDGSQEYECVQRCRIAYTVALKACTQLYGDSSDSPGISPNAAALERCAAGASVTFQSCLEGCTTCK